MSSVSQNISSYQRRELKRVGKEMRQLLIQRAEGLARQTGFVQRRSPISGAAFAQTLVFGFLNQPQASYTDLQQTMGLYGVQVSPQAIQERMSKQAVTFLQRLLESIVGIAIAGPEAPLPLLARFTGVYLQDGTVITLEDNLASTWPGCGSWSEHGGQAGMRIQARLNMRTGQACGPWLQAARQSEHNGPASPQENPLPKGSLYITDAGVVSLAVLRELDQQGVYWLTPATMRLKIVDQRGRVWDLPSFLQHRPKALIDEPVRAGVGELLACRLLAIPLPPRKKRQPAGQPASRKGARHDVQVGRKKQRRRKVRRLKPQAARRQVAKDWLILLSNAPRPLLSIQEARELMRMRWQVELLWKLWKQIFQIDTWRSEQPERIQCEVFAKLIGVMLTHWLSIVGTWSDLHRSLVKASRLVQKVAPTLLLTLQGPLTLAQVLQRTCQAMGHARLNPRRKHPNTSQRLQALCEGPPGTSGPPSDQAATGAGAA